MDKTTLRAGVVLLGLLTCLVTGEGSAGPGAARAAELWVGAAAVDITPDRPVALDGQFHVRIARKADNPITAVAVVIEGREDGRTVDQAVMVTCDLVAIRGTLQRDLGERLRGKLEGFDPAKLFLTATHTHTAPVQQEGKYEIPAEGVMQPREFVEFLLGRLEEVVVEAWQNRRPGGVSWALGHAVVGHNRRAVYAGGSAQMYGATGRPDFRHFESGEDHGLEMLFFWDAEEKPLAVAINVACPAQEVEGRSTINADFWHDVRVLLRERYGEDFRVLGWTGAAGDISPHLMYRKAAEERMRQLRGLTTTGEIARRIVREVDDVFELARKDIRRDVVLRHHVEKLELPTRRITEAEAARARAAVEAIASRTDQGAGDHRRKMWHQRVVDRYEKQQQGDDLTFSFELHVLRVGDVAVATNPFELYLDYGLRIKARSRAVQTFVVQLSGGADSPAGYLATERAVAGGGYSAVPESTPVGPEGGQVLVDRTVEVIGGLW
jgi:hypothetical protein